LPIESGFSIFKNQAELREIELLRRGVVMNSCHLISEGHLSEDRSTVSWRVDLDTEETFFISQVADSVEALSLLSLASSISLVQYNILFLPSGVLLRSKSDNVLVVDLDWNLIREFIDALQAMLGLKRKLDHYEADLAEATENPFQVWLSWLSCPEVYNSSISKTKCKLKRKKRALSACIYRVIQAWTEGHVPKSCSIQSRMFIALVDDNYCYRDPDFKLLLLLTS